MNIVIKIKQDEFTSFKEFADKMYLYFDETFKLVNTAKFMKLLKQVDKELYEKVNILRKEEINADSFVFKLQYIINPLMELKFNGYSFKKINSLGLKILYGSPKIDIYIYDLIKNKLLSYYLRVQGFDKLNPNFYQKIVSLEIEFENSPKKAYFKIGFILAQTQKIVYRRRWYDSIESFFNEILKPNEINDFSETFEKSEYVFAWLELLGKDNILRKYESIVSTMQDWEEK